jgi:ParB family transcriptional regulator, chromosome partitioning protein
MSKSKQSSQIKMIPIDRINILNPRVRNQKIFFDIADNIAQVGLKRPITVTPCRSGTADKDYDLVCGQGRLEAFVACGQTQIPALIIDANEEQALIMSLVENLARRQHRALDLFHGIGVLQERGYDNKAIAAKTGLTYQYVRDILNLLENGEERLLSAVEAGHMPISIAVEVARAPDDDQRILREAYESKQLRGSKLLLVKRLIEQRRRSSKFLKGGKGKHRHRNDGKVSTQDLLKIYQREVDRKRLLTRKAEAAGSRLLFITEVLRRLFKEEHFNDLLRAEGLLTLPKPLASLMEQKRFGYA